MYLAHYTKRFIPEFDAECRLEDLRDAKRLSSISVGHCSFQPILAATLTKCSTSNWE